MPEAAIDVDGDARAAKDDVGASPERGFRLRVDTEAKTQAVQQRTQRDLGRGVATAESLHAPERFG